MRKQHEEDGRQSEMKKKMMESRRWKKMDGLSTKKSHVISQGHGKDI